MFLNQFECTRKSSSEELQVLELRERDQLERALVLGLFLSFILFTLKVWLRKQSMASDRLTG